MKTGGRLRRQTRIRRPHQSQRPVSHQVSPATRKPVFARSPPAPPIIGNTQPLEHLALASHTLPHTYKSPHTTEIQSHALAPKTRAPVHLPSPPLGGQLAVPILGGPLATPSLATPLAAQSLGGKLTLPSLGGSLGIRGAGGVLDIPPMSGPLLTAPLLGRAGQGEQSNLVRGQCGVSMMGGTERILGGQDAGAGQFPWTALIHIRGHQLDKMCAGTLLYNRYYSTSHYLYRHLVLQVHTDCRSLCPLLQNTELSQLQSSYTILRAECEGGAG